MIQVSGQQQALWWWWRIRNTSCFYVIAQGDAWTNAPSNVNTVLASGAETTDLSEFTSGGAQVTNQSTTVKTGSRAFRMQYDNDLVNPAACGLTWSQGISGANFAAHFQLRIATIPTNYNITLFSTVGSATKLELLTTGALKLTESGNATGATILAINTWYQIEISRTKSGTTYLRINESAETNVSADANNVTGFTFGGAVVKDQNPNADIYMDDLAAWYGSDTAPWFNTTNCNLYGTVNAAGTHNDATGVGDTTNKFNNVDDYASHDSDTTYNRIGATTATQKQTHSLADPGALTNPKGITFYIILRAEHTNQQNDEVYVLVVQSGTDYTKQLGSLAASYFVGYSGYDHLPAGGALTQSDIDGLEMGIKVDQFTIGTNGNNGLNVSTSDGTDSDFTGVPLGSPNKYQNIDSMTDDTDYNEDNVLGHRQAHKLGSFSDNDPVWMSVGVRFRLRTTVSGFKYKPYVKSGVTRSYATEETPVTSFGITNYYYFHTDPATGIAWTTTGLQNAEFGIEITEVPAAGEVSIGYKTLLGIGI